MSRFYLGYCALLAATLTVTQFNGWCLADYDKVVDIPTTVRNNPGSYRSHYTHHYSHYSGK